MKGIVFSSDFVLDSNGNERLLEINTDTGFLLNVVEHIDFIEFFLVLSFIHKKSLLSTNTMIILFYSTLFQFIKE